MDVKWGLWTPLRLYNQYLPHTLGFMFCLDYSVDNSFTVVGLLDPKFVRLIIHVQIRLHSFLFLLVFFNS